MTTTQCSGEPGRGWWPVADGASIQVSTVFSNTRPSSPSRATVIRFCVSVPVLSEQMTVAEPIVSVPTSWRTSALARVIFCIASASDTVTLIGSPSGTATTMMMTMYTK